MQLIMKPLQVYVDEKELERLDKWAAERGWTKSQAVRAAIRGLTAEPAGDPVLSLAGMVQGLPADCAENFKRYLSETYVAEAPARYGRGPRAKRAVRRR